ncbi:PD-(D/E)XK nuclease family protein [uncultured Thiodictyon sp.]|jgi:hypothetical protein|uniref:PDDEXK-like family protein n=1 Tax=uncultured Thiodictyon sp. TaxID=1846217 RepID=UPI0025F5CC65|nr:PD-(D/E)XK nuclease family protein [uncultured Thiodictyon sp.]
MSSNEQELLQRISRIHERHEFLDEMTGRRFNIYSIARSERMEEQTHSRMIAELLSPKGLHGQRGAFLNLFLQQTGVALDSSVIDKAVVKSEKRFREENNKGRVDIVVEMRNFLLLIENKIDAGDQDRQVERYWGYAAKFSKCAVLLYLTLDGRQPTKESLGAIATPENAGDCCSEARPEKDRAPDVRPISYARDIIPWLESCVLYCIQNNLIQLAFGIDHYAMLVRKIAGKEMNENDDEFQDIAKALMSTSENALSALKISQVFSDAHFRGRLLNRFMADLRQAIENNVDHRFSYTEEVPERLKPFQSNEQNLIRWCQRGNKSDGWESKGIFFATPGGNYLLHIQFATTAFHYGLVPVDRDLGLDSGSLATYRWAKRAWSKLVWFSKEEVGYASDFEQDFLRLITDTSQIEELAERIVSEASDICSREIVDIPPSPLPTPPITPNPADGQAEMP